MKKWKIYLLIVIVASMIVLPGIVFNHIHPWVMIVLFIAALLLVLDQVINFIKKQNQNQNK